MIGRLTGRTSSADSVEGGASYIAHVSPENERLRSALAHPTTYLCFGELDKNGGPGRKSQIQQLT